MSSLPLQAARRVAVTSRSICALPPKVVRAMRSNSASPVTTAIRTWFATAGGQPSSIVAFLLTPAGGVHPPAPGAAPVTLWRSRRGARAGRDARLHGAGTHGAQRRGLVGAVTLGGALHQLAVRAQPALGGDRRPRIDGVDRDVGGGCVAGMEGNGVATIPVKIGATAEHRGEQH